MKTKTNNGSHTMSLYLKVDKKSGQTNKQKKEISIIPSDLF